jgi:hypothetical protein
MTFAIAVTVRAYDEDAATIVHAEVLRGVEGTEVKRVQPLDRFVPRLGAELRKLALELSGRKFFDGKGVSFAKRLAGWGLGERH